MRLRLSIACFLGLVLSLPTQIASAGNDVQPPAMLSLGASPAAIVAGSNTTITAHVTDDLSGVARVTATFGIAGRAASLSAFFSLVSGTAQDGLWRAIVGVPAAYPSGTYVAAAMEACDAANNCKYIATPTPPLPDGGFTVSGGPSDFTPPALLSLSVSPSSVAAGGTITVTAHVTDDVTGVQNIVTTFGPSAGNQPLPAVFRILSGTANDGIWTASIAIPAAYSSGTYIAGAMQACDAAANCTYIASPTPPLPGGTFVVTGGTSDTTPPTIVALAVSPAAVPVGGRVQVFAHVTDDLSGVAHLAATFGPTLANQPLPALFERYSGTAVDGLWVGAVEIPSAYPVGTYVAGAMEACDAAANCKYIAAPTRPLSDASFIVTSGTAPIVTDVYPNAGSANGGTHVSVSGANLSAGTVIRFDGAPVTGTTYINSTRIDVTTPPHAAGPVSVTVTNPDGQSGEKMSGFMFVAVAPPVRPPPSDPLPGPLPPLPPQRPQPGGGAGTPSPPIPVPR